MRLRSLSLVLLLCALGMACGKYGPPVRVAPRADSLQATQPADPGEEDSDRKDKKR